MILPALVAVPLVGLPLSAPPATPSPTTAESGPAPIGIPDGMGSDQGDGEFPRTITHFAGDATIEAEPQRIVVIGTTT